MGVLDCMLPELPIIQPGHKFIYSDGKVYEAKHQSNNSVFWICRNIEDETEYLWVTDEEITKYSVPIN